MLSKRYICSIGSHPAAATSTSRCSSVRWQSAAAAVMEVRSAARSETSVKPRSRKREAWNVRAAAAAAAVEVGAVEVGVEGAKGSGASPTTPPAETST
eukprot:5171338-Prymnesium_polylepis.3